MTPWGLANRGTKAKTITSCDNAFVTNIVLARDPGAKRMFSVRKRSAKKRQQQHEVGHEGVITGCDGFSLSSPNR